MAQWYYVEGDARVGPVSADEMSRLIAAGRIGPESYVWRDGLPGWEEAAQHFGFPGAGVPPPVPEPGEKRSRRLDRYRPPDGPAPGSAAPGVGAGGARPSGMTGPDGLYIHAPSRGFFEAISVCFRRYFQFSGRASRSEYWFFVLFTFLLGIVTGLLDSMLFGVPMADDVGGPLNTISALVVLIPSFAVAWRRLHDTGRSGWWIGGFFLAMIGAVALVVISVGTAVFSPEGLANATLLLGMLMVGTLIYIIVMLVFMCTRGDPGPNRYG